MSEKNKEYTFNDPKELSKLIKTIESVEVVKDCKEWDWESRFPRFGNNITCKENEFIKIEKEKR